MLEGTGACVSARSPLHRSCDNLRGQVLEGSNCAFERLSPVRISDLSVVFVTVIALLLTDVLLRQCVFGVVYRILGGAQEKLQQWNQSCWEVTYFSFSFFFGCWVVLREPWTFDPKQYWQEYPQLNLSYAQLPDHL